MQIKLGSRVKDIYTGFEGTAVSYTEYMYGCSRYGIECTDLDKDGDVKAIQYFDEQRVTVVEETPAKHSDETTGTNPGGPKEAPRRFGA